MSIWTKQRPQQNEKANNDTKKTNKTTSHSESEINEKHKAKIRSTLKPLIYLDKKIKKNAEGDSKPKNNLKPPLFDKWAWRRRVFFFWSMGKERGEELKKLERAF